MIIALITAPLFAFINSIKGYEVGETVESFTLKNVDGNMVSLNDYKDKKGVIVIFTCNHCPFAVAWEDRINDLSKKYKDSYPVIGINPNDAKKYPSDSFDNMVKRSRDKSFTFPYLHDESQQVAKAFGAVKTPHAYVLKNIDGKFIVKYIGAIDDNYDAPEEVKNKYVEQAIERLKAGKDPMPAVRKAIGCSIKWK